MILNVSFIGTLVLCRHKHQHTQTDVVARNQLLSYTSGQIKVEDKRFFSACN